MNTRVIAIGTFAIVLVIFFAVGIKFVESVKEEAKELMNRPDTTITIRNGVPDTVIVIKKF